MEVDHSCRSLEEDFTLVHCLSLDDISTCTRPCKELDAAMQTELSKGFGELTIKDAPDESMWQLLMIMDVTVQYLITYARIWGTNLLCCKGCSVYVCFRLRRRLHPDPLEVVRPTTHLNSWVRKMPLGCKNIRLTVYDTDLSNPRFRTPPRSSLKPP